MVRPIPRVPRRQAAEAARRTSQTVDVPAPSGGLNTRDSLSLMPINDAVVLTNWVVSPSGVKMRKGYTTATTSYTTTIETVIPYVNGTTAELITVENGIMYTDDGDGTRSSIETGLSNSRWFATKLGANMVLVNGADAPRNYNGSTVTTPSFSGDLSTYGEENIDGITKFRNRVYMWDSSYGNFFYGGVNAVSGSFAEFNLNQISDTSGNILEIKSISRDAGDGPDDFIAFILDTGEIIIYQGSDPGTASNWALVGKYKASPLIAKNCAHEFGGDVLMLTQSDLVKLSDVIKYGSEAGGFNITPSKLSGAIMQDYTNYGTNYGWQLTTHPTEGWIIINVPEVTGNVYHQYVVDTVTGGASRFEGWGAVQFATISSELFFGGSADLYKANVGLDDNGADINLLARPAYNNLGTSRRKKVSNARLYMQSEGTLDVDLSIGYDYATPSFQGTQTSQTSGAEWDVAEWDVAEWAGLSARLVNFVTSGLGLYVTAQVSMKVQGQNISWYSTTYNFDIAEAY